MAIVSQEEQQVKPDDYIFGDLPDEECGYDDCHEPVFRPGFCWDHFIEEEAVEWGNQDAERKTCLAGVGL